ncbi:MAG: NUDIX domain-containing protein [Fimbriimonas sp.]
MRKFPSGQYGRQRLQFFPAPFKPPLRAFASLVFPWDGDRVLICDIADRGWCIPSGRVEPDETSLEAAQREAQEEGGAILQEVQYIGSYMITERNEVRWADCYTATVERLVDIGIIAESKGRQFVTMDELPPIYHLWNELTERVFEHSRDVAQRLREHHSPA